MFIIFVKKLQMKPALKHLLIYTIFVAFIIISALLDKYESYRIVKYLCFGTIFSFFAFNIYARRYYSFKQYFLSKRNIITSKISKSVFTEIPKETILEKIKEVLGHNHLKIKYINPDSNHIMAVSSITWKSWGENIYIDIDEKDDESEIIFTSVAIFQVTSWGKNEQNFKKFLCAFEESLII